MGAIEDNNVPAFQAFVVAMVAGAASILEVYLTPKSWIGVTRLTFPASAADAGELRAVPATTPDGVDGYLNTLSISSTDAQDAGLLSVIVVSDLKGMGQSFPVTP